MDLQDLEQFGADLLERKTEIDKKCESAIPTFPLEFMGKPMKLKVIDVRIGFPVYRLANGRTSTYQLQYLAQHSDLDSDFFKRDNDSITAQMAQNEILLRLIDDENLLKAFKESELQIEPILCTNTGVVVNGNRRLCAWRKLYLSDQVKYKNFQTVEVAILPECDEKAIKTLEKKLQISKTKRAEYKWHAKAMMAEEELKNGGKLPEVAKGYGMSPQKMQEMISKKNYAEK